MKPFIPLLLATSAFCSPLAAQNQGPGNDLIDLFEKSQREGASDEELLRMLGEKTLLDMQGAQPRELTPEQLQHEKDAVFDVLRRLKTAGQPDEARRDGDNAVPRRMQDGPPSDPAARPPRWMIGLAVAPLVPALRTHFDIPGEAGVLVESVMRDGPAAKAGIKPNDIIVTANGRGISSLEELKVAVEKAGGDGNAVKLEVIQRGKRSVVDVAPLGPEPSDREAGTRPPAFANRPLIEMQRRLDQQQREIEELRRELRQLRERINRE
jgi:membrane-associated protease RseP (regulator of RpoE activity)